MKERIQCNPCIHFSCRHQSGRAFSQSELLRHCTHGHVHLALTQPGLRLVPPNRYLTTFPGAPPVFWTSISDRISNTFSVSNSSFRLAAPFRQEPIVSICSHISYVLSSSENIDGIQQVFVDRIKEQSQSNKRAIISGLLWNLGFAFSSGHSYTWIQPVANICGFYFWVVS